MESCEKEKKKSKKERRGNRKNEEKEEEEKKKKKQKNTTEKPFDLAPVGEDTLKKTIKKTKKLAETLKCGGQGRAGEAQ